MTHKMHYETVSKAIEELRKQGYTADFNIAEDMLVYDNENYNTKSFEVVDVYRYEGISDPGDEAAVYAIKSSDGIKGVLVTGYGASDITSNEMLDKLSSAQRD